MGCAIVIGPESAICRIVYHGLMEGYGEGKLEVISHFFAKQYVEVDCFSTELPIYHMVEEVRQTIAHGFSL